MLLTVASYNKSFPFYPSVYQNKKHMISFPVLANNKGAEHPEYPHSLISTLIVYSLEKYNLDLLNEKL